MGVKRFMPLRLIPPPWQSGQAAKETVLNEAVHRSNRDQAKRPYRRRRLSDMVLVAFHGACDQADVEIAWALLNLLELMAMRSPAVRAVEDRRAKESLVAAHVRLWPLRHRSEFSVEADHP
jgi:hypothetical protein